MKQKIRLLSAISLIALPLVTIVSCAQEVLNKKFITLDNGANLNIDEIKRFNKTRLITMKDIHYQISYQDYLLLMKFTINKHDIEFPQSITKEDLTKEAKNLNKSDILYDGKPFDLLKLASMQIDNTRISTKELSDGTKLNVSSMGARGNSIIIKFVLLNGIEYSDEQKFTYTRFITKHDVYNKLDAALTNINNQTIKGDSTTLPSNTQTMSILLLENFPLMSNGIKFEYLVNEASKNDATGELMITLSATMGSLKAFKRITISGFKTTAKIQAELDAILATIDQNTIKGDVNKLPSKMDLASIASLSGFPSPREVHFSVTIKRPNNAKGELVITLKATKEKESKEKELTISGFQKQN